MAHSAPLPLIADMLKPLRHGEGLSLSRKVNLPGREQASRKFLGEQAFLNDPAAPFLDTQLLTDLVTDFYTYLEPTRNRNARNRAAPQQGAVRPAVQGR